MSNIIIINKDNFNTDVIESKYPVLVDFWAEWCGPCKIMSNILNEISEDFKDKIIIAKINVEENQELLQIYEIRSIPTLILFKEGIIIGKIMGLSSKENIIEFICKNI